MRDRHYARTAPRKPARIEPTGEEAPEKGEARPGPAPTVPPTVGEVGVGEREGRVIEGRPPRKPGEPPVRVKPREGAAVSPERERPGVEPPERVEAGIKERPAVPGRPTVRAPRQPTERNTAGISKGKRFAGGLQVGEIVAI